MVRSCREQARSQVFLRGGAIQPGDGPNEGEKVLVGRGGKLWLSGTELRSKFAIGAFGGRGSLGTR